MIFANLIVNQRSYISPLLSGRAWSVLVLELLHFLWNDSGWQSGRVDDGDPFLWDGFLERPEDSLDDESSVFESLPVLVKVESTETEAASLVGSLPGPRDGFGCSVDWDL